MHITVQKRSNVFGRRRNFVLVENTDAVTFTVSACASRAERSCCRGKLGTQPLRPRARPYAWDLDLSLSLETAKHWQNRPAPRSTPPVLLRFLQAQAAAAFRACPP